MIDASSRCDAFLSKSRPLIGTNRCTNPTSSRRENSQAALRAVSPSPPPPLAPTPKPGGEGGPSGYGCFCLTNIYVCWYKRGGRISRIKSYSCIEKTRGLSPVIIECLAHGSRGCDVLGERNREHAPRDGQYRGDVIRSVESSASAPSFARANSQSERAMLAVQ
jgi:hypothetical protein